MERIPIARTAIAIIMLSLGASAAGCVSVIPLSESAGRVSPPTNATPQRSADQTPETGPELVTGIAPGTQVWPDRWGDTTQGLGKGVVVPVEGPLSAWSPRRHGPWHSRVPKGTDLEQVAALANGRVAAEGYRFRMEGYGAFIFERDPDTPAPQPGEPVGRSEPAMMFVFVSGRPEGDSEPVGSGNTGPRIAIERTWFAYYDHRRGGSPTPDDPGTGTVMLLPGLFGIPEQVVDVVTSTMRQRGWNVIRMLAPPARFVEKTAIELDPDDPGSPAEAAGELMHRIAETAYAAEAAWEHVIEARPDLADYPKIVFGGSGGALALPAVVRRDPGRYDGAVVVAGGANILDVVSTSTYTEPVQALDFDWTGYEHGATPPPDVLDAFTKSYLRHAPLDGYHAGAWFGDTPVLIVQASGDRAVPVKNSELLWSRLGEPEKWTISGNHLTLFLSLWLHTPRILDWVEGSAINNQPEGTTP